jgi:hypothetical protein
MDLSQRRFVMVCSCSLAVVGLTMPAQWGADLAKTMIFGIILQLQVGQCGPVALLSPRNKTRVMA